MVIFDFMMMEIILKNCFIMFYMFIHFRCNLTSAFLRLFGGSRYTIIWVNSNDLTATEAWNDEIPKSTVFYLGTTSGCRDFKKYHGK